MSKIPSKIELTEIFFYLNGEEKKMWIPPSMTTLELLHERLGMFGTKSSCNEGDCGSCTVIIGFWETNSDNHVCCYRTINSCIYPAIKLHDKHLITIEGITDNEQLHPIQQALLDEHGTQCGFCTPGFVMSILGLFLNHTNFVDDDNSHTSVVKKYLEGNLCRCTGYDSILKAVEKAKVMLKNAPDLLPEKITKATENLKNTHPKTTMKKQIIDNQEGWITSHYYIPNSIEELWSILKSLPKDCDYQIINGGTDLMVQANIQNIRHSVLIDISSIPDMDKIYLQNEELHIGANVTYSQIERNQEVKIFFPLLIKAICQIAGQQIRNCASLSGNIANASPVADGATTLLALEAELLLLSEQSQRRVLLKDFYHGYKQMELKKNEIIKTIILPIPKHNKIWNSFLKSAKRNAVDISSVVSALIIEYEEQMIKKAILSYGGVAPYPALAKKTMAWLTSKKLNPRWFEQAGKLAQSEFAPITDIRGTDAYRSLLIKNQLVKHLQNCYNYIKNNSDKED